MINTMTAGPVDAHNIRGLSLTSLAALYRELTGKTTKKFRDRETALKRVTPVVEDKIRRAVAPRPKRTSTRALLNIPPKSEIARYRPGTKRAALINWLREDGGASLGQVKERFGWKTHLARCHLWSIGKYVGFGVREDAETGIIRLTTKEEEERS